MSCPVTYKYRDRITDVGGRRAFRYQYFFSAPFNISLAIRNNWTNVVIDYSLPVISVSSGRIRKLFECEIDLENTYR